MTHSTTPEFWAAYDDLPNEIQELADKNYQLLKADPQHPSLHFRPVGPCWSARVGRRFRALAVENNCDFVWFWIGTHAVYDRLLKA